MTATLPTRGPSVPGGPPRVRLDARPGSVYCYDVLDAATGQVVHADYVGQARDPARRDKQHRGQIPQRDGQIREQPWADLIVGGMRILEQGIWSDTELDARELAWMAHLLPRLNCQGSVTPDRIPIYVQRDQRDARDMAAGLVPRDWSRPGLSASVLPRPAPSRVVPSSSAWRRFWASPWGRRLADRLRAAGKVAAVWVAFVVAGTVALTITLHIAPDGAATVAGITATLGMAKWWPRRKPRRRRR